MKKKIMKKQKFNIEEFSIFHSIYARTVIENGVYLVQYAVVICEGDATNRVHIEIVATRNAYSFESKDGFFSQEQTELIAEYFNHKCLLIEAELMAVECLNGASGVVEEMHEHEKYGRQVFSSDIELELDDDGTLYTHCA